MNTVLSQLRDQRDQIALEAFATADVRTLLTDTFPAMVRGLIGYTDQFVPETEAIVLTPDQNNFIKEISKHRFLEISALAAFVPEGLNTTYYHYSSQLLLATIHASRILTGSTTAYSTFLAMLITNVEQKFSTKSFDIVYHKLAQDREELNEALGACFAKGSTRSERTLADVIDRNADWTHVFHNGENITKLINSVDRKALNKKIIECKGLLEVLMKKIERNEFEGISPQVLKNLSDGAYQVASELEFYAAVYYKILAYTTAVNNTIQHCRKVLK